MVIDNGQGPDLGTALAGYIDPEILQQTSAPLTDLAPSHIRRKLEVLRTAERLTCADRARVYGPPAENFARTAALWEPIIGRRLSPREVALCLLLLKVARLIETPEHTDSWVDIAGYAACGHAAGKETDGQ